MDKKKAIKLMLDGEKTQTGFMDENEFIRFDITSMNFVNQDNIREDINLHHGRWSIYEEKRQSFTCSDAVLLTMDTDDIIIFEGLYISRILSGSNHELKKRCIEAIKNNLPAFNILEKYSFEKKEIEWKKK